MGCSNQELGIRLEVRSQSDIKGGEGTGGGGRGEGVLPIPLPGILESLNKELIKELIKELK